MSIRVETTVTGPGPGEMNQMLAAVVQNTFVELIGRYQASFNPPAWQWPRETKRYKGRKGGKSGKTKRTFVVVGSPRNLKDRGTLSQSFSYSSPNPFVLEATWSADYATAKHEGARLRNGTILPATPWTDAVRGTVEVSGIPVFPLGRKLQQRIQRAVAGS
jgi:hypothetical protein